VNAACAMQAAMPLPAVRSERARVLDAIRAEPGSTPAEIAADAKVAGARVEALLRELADAGAIVPCGRSGWIAA